MIKYESSLKEEIVEKAELLRVLSHPERLAIVLLVLEKERCVKDLVENLNVSQPKVSQHVGLMKEMGILTFRREGAKVIYRIADERIEELVTCLVRHLF